ncbi:MAG: ParB/RepB/Spo0J family partition protein, partial [Candidatus Aureabacteria bacterium]|nr:ParB/RepB/Spo0J family partition protein [Candidatus Auribacterota bacterium]
RVKEVDMRLLEVEREKITAPVYRIRFQSGTKEVEELARSIQANGLLCPLLVKVAGGGKYSLVAGARRLAALDKLGWEKAPCLELGDADEGDSLIKGIAENIGRLDLFPLERGMAFAEIVEKYGYTQRELSEKIGKDESYVSHYLRLLKLIHPKILDLLRAGKISYGHGQALMILDDQEEQLALARRIVAEHLTIAETALLVDQARPVGELTDREKEFNAVERDVMKLKKEWRSRIKMTQGKKQEAIHINFLRREELKELLRKIADAL